MEGQNEDIYTIGYTCCCGHRGVCCGIFYAQIQHGKMPVLPHKTVRALPKKNQANMGDDLRHRHSYYYSKFR